MYAEAEAAYYRAFELLPASRRECTGPNDLVCYLYRSLVSLQERDGLPVLRDRRQGKPILFLSSSILAGAATTTASEPDAIREFTSEALYSGSRTRNDRVLTSTELSSIVRRKPQARIANRATLHLGGLPAIELLYQRSTIDNAQITSFWEPANTNAVEIDIVGLALNKPIGLYPLFDALLRVQVNRGYRRGLIEFWQDSMEIADEVVARAIASRFVGPDKINLEFTLANASIEQRLDKPMKRELEIIAPAIRYQVYRSGSFQRRIARRGSEVMFGLVAARETFGEVTVRRTDRFVRLELRGLPGLKSTQSFDLSLQPTHFSSRRSGIDEDTLKAQALPNSQLRTSASVLYRLVDRENQPSLHQLPKLVLLNAVLLASNDEPRRGPSTFAGRSIGAGIEAKVVFSNLRGGTTFLTSSTVEFQRYHELGRTVPQWLVNLSLGF